jgi:REP element-mobilizing transposase RayT
MVFDPKKHHRRSIRIKDYDYSSGHAYYITICTEDRKCILSEVIDGKSVLNENGKIVERCVREIKNRYHNAGVNGYVIMPNHVHLIIQIAGAIHESPLQGKAERRKMLLPKIIGYLKMNTGKHINILAGTTGKPVWQKNYFEHIIRNEKAYYGIVEYIENNPLLWEADEYNPDKKNK